MLYLCAGLYGEGPTDYRFLMPLLDRLLWEVAVRVLPQPPRIADTVAIDAPDGSAKGRRYTLPAAIDAYWDTCTLFVIHSDGGGKADEIRRTCIAPGLTEARRLHPELASAACVPVRELEAWMLTDSEAFRKLTKIDREPALPRDPEADPDPKRTLRQVLQGMGAQWAKLEEPYSFFGANVRLETLRRLPAFQRFEGELADALRQIARHGANAEV